jgi:hypothetical protein
VKNLLKNKNMEKQYITEIERILEIMGVEPSKNLITEANIFQKVLGWGEKILTNAKRIPGASLDELEINGMKVRRFMHEKLLKVLREQIPFSELTGVEAYSLGRLLSTSKDEAEKIYKEQIRKALKDLKMSEQELITNLKNQINQNGGDVRNTLKTIFQDPNNPTDNSGEFLSGLMGTKIQQRIDDLNSGNFKNEIFRPEDKWKVLLKNLESSYVKALREIFIKYYKKSQDELEDEIVRRLDLIEEKLTRVSPEGKTRPQNVGADMRELFNIIAAWKKSAGDEIEPLLNLHIFDNPKIPARVKETLKKSGYVEEFMKHMNEEIYQSAFSVVKNTIKSYAKTIPFLNGAIKGFEKEGYKYLENLAKDSVESVGRIISYITYKSPQFPSEILSNSIRAGRNATLVEKVMGYLFLDNVAIPWSIATIEGWLKNSNINKFNDTIKIIQELCAAGQLDNCPSEEEMKQLENYTREQFTEEWMEHAPLYKLFFGQNGERKGSDFLFMTYLDETYNFIKNWRDSALYEKGDFLEKQLEKLKGYQGEIDTWLKQRGIDPEDKGRLEQMRSVMNKQYKPDETSFKQYLIDQGGYDSTLINSQKNLKQGDLYNYDGDNYQFEKGTFTLVPEQ